MNLSHSFILYFYICYFDIYVRLFFHLFFIWNFTPIICFVLARHYHLLQTICWWNVEEKSSNVFFIFLLRLNRAFTEKKNPVAQTLYTLVCLFWNWRKDCKKGDKNVGSECFNNDFTQTTCFSYTHYILIISLQFELSNGLKVPIPFKLFFTLITIKRKILLRTERMWLTVNPLTLYWIL